MMRLRISVSNNRILCCNEGDLSESVNRSKFWWCKFIIPCCQRQSVEENDPELVNWGGRLHLAQTCQKKIPDESSGSTFDRSTMASRPGRFKQFAETQSRFSLHSNLHRHSI